VKGSSRCVIRSLAWQSFVLLQLIYVNDSLVT